MLVKAMALFQISLAI